MLGLTLALLLAPAGPRPPVARTVDEVVGTLHGESRHDEYAWMRAGPDDPAVGAHLDAENAYAQALLRPHRRLRRTLEREIELRAYVDHESVPVRRGAWLYWTRQSRRADHPVYLRRPAASPDAAPQVVLDVDRLARGKPFFDLGTYELSDDGRWLAYAIDETGHEDYTLFIRDLETGAPGPDRLARVTSAAWTAGARELLYTVRDDTHRAYALWSHTRGEVGGDRLLFTENDAAFDLSVARSRSGEWLIVASDSYLASEVQVARAERSAGPWRVIAARQRGHLYDLDHAGDHFYIRSNYAAPNFHVMTAPEDDPRPARWRTLVPERPDIAVTGVHAFAGHIVLTQREQGRPRLAIVDRATGVSLRAGDVDAARGQTSRTQGLAGMWPGENPDPTATTFRVHVESVHEAEVTVDVALRDGAETVVGRRVVPGPCGGVARSVGTARAPDGTQIPYLYFGGSDPGGGPRPVLLEVYGAYGSTFDPDFDPSRCALLERGVDFVIAWVRGGGELGEPWHAAGRLGNRMHAITDFIAVAQTLIATRATTSALLVVAGESAGGSLVAGAVNLRPELFAAAVLRVPFLDALGTMSDSTAPLTTLEYEEWGDPAVRADYDAIKQWCPYTNIAARDYPPIFVGSSLADERVAYHEQARYVARLRARGRGGPFILRTEIHAGHGGASSRPQWLRARADELAFILTRSWADAR